MWVSHETMTTFSSRLGSSRPTAPALPLVEPFSDMQIPPWTSWWQDLPMLFGLFPINTSALADPELMARVAVAADEAGIESVFTGEHVVVPDPLAPPSHVPPETVLVHPSTALAFCAAVTRRLKLGTGITLLPSHNPLVVAKEYGSLDHLSGGRLVLGIGVG